MPICLGPLLAAKRTALSAASTFQGLASAMTEKGLTGNSPASISIQLAQLLLVSALSVMGTRTGVKAHLLSRQGAGRQQFRFG